MKKSNVVILLLIFLFLLVGCNTKLDYNIKIVIPAGSQGEFVYSDEELSPVKDQLSVKSIDIPEEAKFVLTATEDSADKKFECANFPKGEPMVIHVENGTWVKIGISMQNQTDEDLVVMINLEKAKVKIP